MVWATYMAWYENITPFLRGMSMRIALFIFGALAAGYLIVKGFKQMLAESRESDSTNEDGPRQLPRDKDEWLG